MYLLDIYQKVHKQEFGKNICKQKVELLLRLSDAFGPKDEKTQQVSRTWQDIASTCSASCAVREINFVDLSAYTEDELRFLCGRQQNQNQSI